LNSAAVGRHWPAAKWIDLLGQPDQLLFQLCSLARIGRQGWISAIVRARIRAWANSIRPAANDAAVACSPTTPPEIRRANVTRPLAAPGAIRTTVRSHAWVERNPSRWASPRASITATQAT
jgi:hypothetical protein